MSFDAAYYHRFYRDPVTRATSREEMNRRAAWLAAYLKLQEIPVRRILDAGCGLGLMRPRLKREFPRASYTGIDVSEHTCRRYGWIQTSIADFRSRTPFDLVICFDVMQYLTDVDASRAIANLAALCRGALYLQVLTRVDWQRHADRSATDGDVRLRNANWYRTRLRRHFRHLGHGLYLRRGAFLTQWELEQPWC